MREEIERTMIEVSDSEAIHLLQQALIIDGITIQAGEITTYYLSNGDQLILIQSSGKRVWFTMKKE